MIFLPNLSNRIPLAPTEEVSQDLFEGLILLPWQKPYLLDKGRHDTF
jgi:hypothetical protein